MHDIFEPRQHMIDYAECDSLDPQAMRAFLEVTLGWSFEWFGPDYVVLRGVGLEGVVYRADMGSRSADGGALIVSYDCDLEASEALVLSLGASIIKPIFDFPGGRQFQFAEPTDNEFTFWSNV